MSDDTSHLERLKSASLNAPSALGAGEPAPLGGAPAKRDQDYHQASDDSKGDDDQYPSTWHKQLAQVNVSPAAAREVIDTLLVKQRPYVHTFTLAGDATVSFRTASMGDIESEHSVAENLQPHYVETLNFVRTRHRMVTSITQLNGENWESLSYSDRVEKVNSMSAPLYGLINRRLNTFTAMLAAVFSDGYVEHF